MKKINSYQIALGFAVIFLIIALTQIITGNLDSSGPVLIAMFLSLAIGVRGFTAFKGFSYTIWIFTAVTAAMFYPQYFTTIGNFQFKILIVPLLQIIMFGMGSQMSLDDFTGVIKMPKGVIIGVGSHYLIMPWLRLRFPGFLIFLPK